MQRRERVEAMRDEILEKVISYRAKISAYQVVLTDFEEELSKLAPSTPAVVSSNGNIESPESAPSDVGIEPDVDADEFVGKTQAEAARTLVKREGEPLHIATIVKALEKGGVPVGGSSFQKKKDNLASTLNRSGLLASLGNGKWKIVEEQKSDLLDGSHTNTNSVAAHAEFFEDDAAATTRYLHPLDTDST